MGHFTLMALEEQTELQQICRCGKGIPSNNDAKQKGHAKINTHATMRETQKRGAFYLNGSGGANQASTKTCRCGKGTPYNNTAKQIGQAKINIR